MARSAPSDVTRLLMAWESGDEEAFDQLCPLVYGELRRLAQHQMRDERSEHTLQATALVHEAVLRLTKQQHVSWESRSHFMTIAAKMMRRVLVDYARRRLGLKRGGQYVHLPQEETPEVSAKPPQDVLAVNDALEGLAKVDPRKAAMIELRFFGGFSIDETAAILQVSPGTVMRDWTLAKAWLQRELRGR